MGAAALPTPRFGLHLPQAGMSWSQVLEGFELAEALGFDTAWLSDHLLDSHGSVDRPILEAWTLLAAIAAATSRIRLGILVSGNTFRHPALLAKEAVTVDHISGGRLILGVGAGWNEDEHRRYGIDFSEPSVRVARLEEAVRILISLMSEERTSFSGRHYRLVDAPFLPGPVQRPRIPILIAAHRPRMIAIAARYADQWDTYPSIPGASTGTVREDVADRVRRFEAACRRAGRDPSLIRRSTTPVGDVFASESAYTDFVRSNRALGFTDFIAEPTPRALERVQAIAERTIPALRSELAGGVTNA